MMKTSPLTTVLLGLVGLSVLLSLALCFAHISADKELRVLKTQFNQVNQNRTAISGLVAESLEYSKRNPAINPILEQAGLKPKEGAAPRPAGK